MYNDLMLQNLDQQKFQIIPQALAGTLSNSRDPYPLLMSCINQHIFILRISTACFNINSQLDSFVQYKNLMQKSL